MVEIKNNNLIIDGKSTPIDEINMIQSAKGKLYFSNNIVEISKESHDIKELNNIFQQAGLTNFVLIDNVIVNTENVSDIYVKYFQYAGISIFQCNKENAEMYMLVMTCKNGKAETISFSSIEELEKYRNIIENSIANLKSLQMNIG